ncbi:MAG: hypothetical protein COW65_14855 [Cytophagales bacterium CG18_big_fil_WC_8_21_14_2_50_42_9]|nr:MAG: hypothetical protein COW65_14855 [Cytophagales bacterium CG18_big_fil_WC_8_21_14_2_50_42_9]
MGEQLLNRRMYAEAIPVFSLSLAKDSTSVPAQLGIGEAYLKNKQKAMALDHLKKALALSPQNIKLERKIKLLDKPDVTINPKLAESYTGKYKSAIGDLTVTNEEGCLFVQLEGNPKEELLPDTKDIFISADAGVQLQFLQEHGITKIEMTAGTQKFLATKLK